MRVQGNCKGGGGPVLVSALEEDNGNNDSNGNNDGNGGVGPLLATDARRDNNENGDVHGEGNCGGGGSGDGGGDNGDNNDDDDDEGGGNNDNHSSDDDDNGGGDNDDDVSDGDDNGGYGGDGGGGCDTDTATVAGILDTDNRQQSTKSGNGQWARTAQRSPMVSMLRNFLVSFFAFAFCKELPWGTTQVLTWTVLSSHPAPCPRKPTVLATIPTIWTRSSEIHTNTSLAREKLLLHCGCPVVLAGRLALLVFAVLSIRSGHPTVEIDSPTARWVRRRDFHCE
jgi:hypothetical protein